MSFYTKIFDSHRKIFNHFDEVARKKAIFFKMSEDRSQCFTGFDFDKVQGVTRDLLFAIRKMGPTHVMEFFLSSQIIHQGPKIFRPSQITCEALENTDIRIPFSEYHQPFTAMIVEFPENYANNKIAQCPQAGTNFFGVKIPAEHQPGMVGVYYNEQLKVMVVGVYFSSGQAITRFLWDKNEVETLEDAIKISGQRQLSFADGIGFTDEEVKITENAVKVALNSCLLLMDYGCKKIGPDNPNHYDRCQRRAQRRGNTHADIARRELHLTPIVYDIEQNIKLYKEAKKDRDIPEGDAHKVGPHWRRGHWAMQPYGPQQSLRKRILRPAILVNKHLLAEGQKIRTQYRE